MLGREDVYESVNILLNADLTPWTAHRPAGLYFIENQKIRGTFLTINATDRWGFLINTLKPFGIVAKDLTQERSAELVRTAAGVPDLDVKILGVVPWTASALVAERYVHDRIFLAGDAAHEMPPTGGFGFNTGVQDVHNLAWKLAAVLHGVASPSLLETYHDERAPVGHAITEQSLANATSMGRLEQTKKNASARPEYLNEQGMIFGAKYTSRAVVPDGTDAVKVANAVTDYAPSARPGGRAPHVWFERDGERISTIDVVGKGFALLTGSRGEAWQAAASACAGETRMPLKSAAVAGHEFNAAYEIDDDGAVLVRPDGYVAWRIRTATRDPSSTLREAMTSILGLST
jgi:hypothetical protein